MTQFRGQIVSFSPTTYRATVRLEASPTNIPGVHVNRLLAESIQPGRKCLVDTGDHGDIEDIVVLAVWAEDTNDHP